MTILLKTQVNGTDGGSRLQSLPPELCVCITGGTQVILRVYECP